MAGFLSLYWNETAVERFVAWKIPALLSKHPKRRYYLGPSLRNENLGTCGRLQAGGRNDTE